MLSSQDYDLLKKAIREVLAEQNPILNIEEVAQLTGYQKSYLYVLVCQNKIPYFKQGRLLRFHRQEVQTWILTNSNQ